MNFNFKKIVNEITPPVNFATKGAIEMADNIFRLPQVVALVTEEFNKEYMLTIFQKEFLDNIISKLKNVEKKEGMTFLKKFVKKNVPLFIKDRLRRSISKPSIEPAKVAFRVFMIGRMYKILSEDAKVSA